jgi:hypothetical protein
MVEEILKCSRSEALRIGGSGDRWFSKPPLIGKSVHPPSRGTLIDVWGVSPSELQHLLAMVRVMCQIIMPHRHVTNVIALSLYWYRRSIAKLRMTISALTRLHA